MTALKRAGYDLIQNYDNETRQVQFKDGSIEIPPYYGSFRATEICVALSHPAIRDVHICCMFMGTTYVTIQAIRDFDFSEVAAVAKIAVEQRSTSSYQVAVECFDWT